MIHRRLLVVLIFSLMPVAYSQTAQNTNSSASVPRLVNFSGKATDAQRRSISGATGVTFSIYKEQYEGSPLWMETQNVQADKSGNYTAQLGATKSEGLPIELFSSGEARWLGVRVNGGEEQPRVLLLSVPYALKAADAQTLGGLPPSAFVLAAPVVGAANPEASGASGAATSSSAVPPPATITGSGTANFVSLFTGASTVGDSALFQSGASPTAKFGINTSAPTTALDVHGGAAVRGTFVLPATGVSTASAGKLSQPQQLVASSFSSTIGTPVAQTFQWQAEPANNNTANPGATLSLLFGSGATKPAETGLRIGPKGIIGFAPGQTFPGSGSVHSVGLSAPGSDFTVSGSPVTGSGTLGLQWNVVPTADDVGNAIVKRDASGSFSGGIITAVNLTASNPSGVAVWGQSSGTSGGSDGVHGVTSSGSASGVAGVNTGDGGVGVWGEAPTGFGFYTPNNVQQARTAGGWVKAMVYVNGRTAPYQILRCFNSTLAGAAATTPPCGINFTEEVYGHWDFDFGFEVDDRFMSATIDSNLSSDFPVQIVAGPAPPFPTNVVRVVVLKDSNNTGAGATFYLIVY
jgi:hypothetical protein